jgi:hypothetical protein
MPLNGLAMVECDGIVGAMLMVARSDGQQGHCRERGEEGAVAAEDGGIAGVVFGGAWEVG